MAMPASARSISRASSLRRSLGARPALLLLPFLAVFLAVPLLAPYRDSLFDDQAGYIGLARSLVDGHYLSGRDDLVAGGPAYPNLWFGPGLPALLAPLVALHLPVDAIRLLGPLLLFGALLAFYALLRLFVPVRPALLGAAAFGLYLPFYTTIAYLHSEVPGLLLLVVTVYATARHLRERGRGTLVLAAASLAGLALTRAEFGWVVSVLLVFFAAAWLLYRDGRLGRLAAVYGLALALCLPWLAYTYSVSHTPLTWASSGPLSLYWMSSPQPADRGDWHGADSVFSDPRLASHRPFFRDLQGSDLAAQNRELVDRALSNVRSHPVKFLKNVTDNLGRMWFNAPYSFKSPGATSAIYALPNAAVLLALLAGLLGVRRLPRYPLLVFGSLVGASFLLHAVLSAYPRMLFPVVPFAIWLVVLARTRALPEVRDA